MARSAADGLLDLTVDNIIPGVSINLAESPDLVVTLYVVEIPNQYTRLADLIGDEDLTVKLVGHVRFRGTLGTSGGDGERPDVRVIREMQVITRGGDDTRCARVVLCGSQWSGYTKL